MATIYDRRLVQNDRQREVSRVVVTATDTLSTVTDAPQIWHWYLHLVLAPSATAVAHDTQSVVFNMIPTNPPTGCLLISSEPEPTSTAQNKVELSIATSGSPTVQQIIDDFKAKGMDRYNFDDTGSGCLWWLWTGLNHLEQAQLVEAGATEQLRRFHEEQITLHPERHPIPLRKGQFY